MTKEIKKKFAELNAILPNTTALKLIMDYDPYSGYVIQWQRIDGGGRSHPFSNVRRKAKVFSAYLSGLIDGMYRGYGTTGVNININE